MRRRTLNDKNDIARKKAIRSQHSHFVNLLSWRGCNEFKNQIRLLSDEIYSARPEIVIISTEALGNPAFSMEYISVLRNIFPTAEAQWVYYIRWQDELVISQFAQAIRSGNIAWPNGIKESECPERLDHYSCVDKIRCAVPGDEISVISFGDTKNDHANNFFKKCGVCYPYDVGSHYHENSSAPWIFLRIIWILNSLPNFLPKKYIRRQLLRLGEKVNKTRLAILFDKPAPLSEKGKKELFKKYENSNNNIKEMLS